MSLAAAHGGCSRQDEDSGEGRARRVASCNNAAPLFVSANRIFFPPVTLRFALEARMPPAKRSPLSHVDASGQARMVDVSAKSPTARTAVATARITAHPQVVKALLAGELPKGDTLAVARIAGIQAAKRTAELIPLCHPLPLDAAEIDIAPSGGDALVVTARIGTTARTGVEMEALTAASIAALTIYDMAKSLDKTISIGPIRLERKTGGKSGEFQRRNDE